jgi:hypothetical protein
MDMAALSCSGKGGTPNSTDARRRVVGADVVAVVGDRWGEAAPWGIAAFARADDAWGDIGGPVEVVEDVRCSSAREGG